MTIQTALSLTDTLSSVKDQVSNSMAATWNDANSLVGSQLNQVSGVTQNLVDQVIQAIAFRIQSWLELHPLAAWVLLHPLLTGVILLVIVFLLWSLLQTLLLLTQNLWAKILQLPLLFGLLVVRGIVALFRMGRRRVFKNFALESHLAQESMPPAPQEVEFSSHLGPVIPEGYRPEHADPDVMALFIRLEELSHEQNQILRQLTSRLQQQLTDHP